MNKTYLYNIGRFIVLLLVQGLLLTNTVIYGGKAQVFLYLLFIIMLPFRISPILAMSVSFLMGLGVDMFYDSPGLHASAATFVAFVRPYFIRYLTPREDYDINDQPNISSMGLLWFLSFSAILISLHSIWLFFLEAFGFGHFTLTMIKVLATSALTLTISVITVLLFSRKRT